MIGTSDSSPERLYPKRRRYSPVSSSHTSLLRFFLTMPFRCAKASHLVGARGCGSGLARGSGVVGAGRCAIRPSCHNHPRDLQQLTQLFVMSSFWQAEDHTATLPKLFRCSCCTQRLLKRRRPKAHQGSIAWQLKEPRHQALGDLGCDLQTGPIGVVLEASLVEGTMITGHHIAQIVLQLATVFLPVRDNKQVEHIMW